jgi:hypothetical protein
MHRKYIVFWEKVFIYTTVTTDDVPVLIDKVLIDCTVIFAFYPALK